MLRGSESDSEELGESGEDEEGEEEEEEDDMWRPETATPAFRTSSRRSRNATGRRSGMARSLTSALEKVGAVPLKTAMRECSAWQEAEMCCSTDQPLASLTVFSVLGVSGYV